MKLKFTLHRAAGPVDLVATVDGVTTIGDLARHLVASDPAGASVPDADATLGLTGRSYTTLDPRGLVAESPLRSGAVVSLSRAGTVYTDPQQHAAAIVRVVSGPDTGREFPIARGSSVLGRDRGVDVRLSDPLVSRRHARINVTDSVEIIDLGSANGLTVDDAATPRSILRASDVVQLGDTSLRVAMRPVPSSDTAAEASVAIIRSPRLNPVFEGRTFEVPELPERSRPQRFPVIALLAPVLMGGLLYLITKSVTSLVFVALSPLLLIGNALESRFAGNADYKRAVKEFRADVESLIADADDAAREEVTGRAAEHPSTADCVAAVRERTTLLWSRHRDQRGFGDVRLGVGSLPSRTIIELPHLKRSARALFKEMAAAVARFASVQPVPVVASLTGGALGICGPRLSTLPVARATVMQLLALHSPAELVICAVGSSRSRADWDWIKWAPHASSAHSPLTARSLAAHSAAGSALVSELEDLLESRTSVSGDAPPATPAIVLLVEHDATVEHSRLVALAERGAGFGVHVVWIADALEELPAACSTYVDLGRDGTTGSVGFVQTATDVTPVVLERVDVDLLDCVARSLAPMIDLGARTDDASDLPRSVSLLALPGVSLTPSAEAVIERWTENRSIVTGPCAPPRPPKHIGTLRAVVGQSAGEVHAIDLRADGPHALVGGTTGAGKSELLQAWILAMAAAHSPQRLTFLLVDYKGGSAFRDCVDLPHTVGLVTDLGPHEVRRALTSLSAELKYREHLLAKHGAKDLVTLEKQGVAEAPPSLVIVVDEFAALVNEVPEFVDGVVNVAQRGRSLGLHLILATQRPAGVIKDNLRANTNLRIALRMADEADSSDVLGSAQAAFFDPGVPGRAVSKTGPGRLVPFQTAYAGGWTTDEQPPPEILVEELAFGAGATWALPETADEVVAVDPGPTDIRRLVEAIRGASATARLSQPRKPWLPELKHVYDLSNQQDVPTRRSDAEIVFGVRDDPDNQQQPTVAFHPDRDGNLAVYGTGGTGKSTLLRTLAIAAGFTVRGGPCRVYGIDFGARGLSMLEVLPHVGSIVQGSDHERITRLLGLLRAIIDERAQRYSRVNAGTITDYRTMTGAADEARILLQVDGVAAFRQAYESSDRMRWFDMFTSIASDGRPVGVHVIVSADQRSGIPSTLASSMQARVVLRLASADDYGILGVPPDVLTVASPPGRGLFHGNEVQVAVLGGSPEMNAQSTAVRGFADSMERAGAAVAPPIGSLPEAVPLRSLDGTDGSGPAIGIGATNLGPFMVEPRGSFVVSGPPGSGRSTALRTLAAALRQWRPDMPMYLFGPARSTLAGLSVWSGTAGTGNAAALAAQLSAQLPVRTAQDAPVAVFIESIADFVNGPSDTALQELARLLVAEDQFLVVEGESSTLTSTFGLMGYAKASRSGLALQPDQGDGTGIYRTNFPRIDRAEFPPGRALSVRFGRVEVVQVAMSD